MLGIIAFICGYVVITGSIPREADLHQVPKTDLNLPAGFDYFSPFSNFPAPDTFTWGGDTVSLAYHADSLLNDRVHTYLTRYRPEAAVFLICDLKTGNILALGERRDSAVSRRPDMAFGKEFPAASLFKIATATAALKSGMGPEDSIVQIGAYHTLYRSQLKPQAWENAPKVTLKNAFAKSVNPAFGLLGLKLGKVRLDNSIQLLGFNRDAGPGRLHSSMASIPDSGYSLAETACGFTQHLTMSPLHGLEIARMIGDDGKRKICRFSDEVSILSRHSESKKLSPSALSDEQVLSSEMLAGLQALMENTISHGTARKPLYRVLKKSHLDKLVMGGKTGSLDGPDPKGRYDWFIGYARHKEHAECGIAIAVMQVHQTYRSLGSAGIAGLLVRDWLKQTERALKTGSAG